MPVKLSDPKLTAALLLLPEQVLDGFAPTKSSAVLESIASPEATFHWKASSTSKQS